VVRQLDNNTPDQVMIGDYPGAVQDAVMDSLQAHGDMASPLLQNPMVAKEFARLLLDVIIKERGLAARTRHPPD
jgi:type I restriction enzyme R subunit